MENPDFTLICLHDIVTDMVSRNEFPVKIGRIVTAERSWKIANLVMESHGKVMEIHFRGFVGTLSIPY